MSTFTLQDLNLPMTADEAIKAVEMGKALANHELAHQQAQQNMLDNINPTTEDILNNISLPHAPEPQPTLESVINNICTQLQLLTTLITSSATKPTEPEAGENSLQETVSLTLQQADWFKEMVEQTIDKYDFDEIVGEAVSDKVCSEVEHYFDYSFDPSDHFDFGDAVCNEVDDRLDDVVRERLDDVVQEQLEELVAEKLKNVRVVFD